MTQQTDAPYEPLTPIQVEEQLRKLHNASREAEKDIRACRNMLVRARGVLTSAKAVLKFAAADVTTEPECPVVGRGDGEVTAAYRDAYVVKRTRAEQMAVVDAHADVDRAAATLESARDFAKSVSEQLIAVTAINKSVIEGYRGSGGHR